MTPRPPWTVLAVLVGTLALVSVSFWQRGEIQRLRGELVRVDLAHAQKLLDVEDAQRVRELSLQSKVTAAQAAHEHEQADLQAVAAGLRADRDGLRRTVAAYVGPAAPGDSCAPERARAETLGLLLGEAVELAGESAGAADESGASLRAVLAAWPSVTAGEVDGLR